MKGVQRNITDILKASITTDSIEIFSITFSTLVTVYWTYKIVKKCFQKGVKGVQRNITDILKASITTDSIEIFSITFSTLVTVYWTYKIVKDAFRIVLYITTFYMQHCTAACFV